MQPAGAACVHGVCVKRGHEKKPCRIPRQEPLVFYYASNWSMWKVLMRKIHARP